MLLVLRDPRLPRVRTQNRIDCRVQQMQGATASLCCMVVKPYKIG